MPEHERKADPASILLLSRIPAFPPVAMKVARMASQEGVRVRELVDVLMADPVFSAQILRVANSPLFGLRAKVDSLPHALVLLGMKRVQALSVTLAAKDYMGKVHRLEARRRCWRHTLACALLSEQLSEACSVPPDLAYTAGLLHDLGRLGLLVCYPREYESMLGQADRVPQALLDLEKHRFGMDHCEAGRWLAEKWQLPDDVRLIAGRHHDRPMGELDLLGVVYWGCQLADALGFDVVTPLQPADLTVIGESLPAEVRRRLPNDLSALRDAVEEKIRQHDAAITDTGPAPVPSRPEKVRVAPSPAVYRDSFDLLLVSWLATLAMITLLAGGFYLWLR